MHGSGILSTCWHFLFENTSPLKSMATEFKFCWVCHFQNFKQAEEWRLSGNMEWWNTQELYLARFSCHPFQCSLFHVLHFSVCLPRKWYISKHLDHLTGPDEKQMRNHLTVCSILQQQCHFIILIIPLSPYPLRG